MTAPSLAPIHTALLQLLRTGTGKQIGDLGAPPEPVPPYGFLAKVDARWSGSLRNPHEQVAITYQLTCVALDSAGVEWLEAKARQVLAEPPVVPGWSLSRWRPPLDSGQGGIRLDRDVTPHLAFSTPQWRMWAQPTPA